MNLKRNDTVYYKLAEHILLRGWNNRPYGLVDRRTGRSLFVTKEVMDVLSLANGKIDFSLPLISDIQRRIADLLVKDKVLLPCKFADPIAEKQNYQFFDNCYMAEAFWSITGKCNYKCRHCYLSAGDNKYGELSHEDIMRIIDEIASCGIYQVGITGGEPLTRPDFFEIIDALLERDIFIKSINSNGHLINEQLLEGLEKREIKPAIVMSFDGTDGWHEWLRGVPNATKAVERAFRLCREHGFTTKALMCLHERNKHTLRESVNYLAGLGCSSLITGTISDIGAWHEGGYGKSMDAKDLFEVYMDYVPKYFEDGMPMPISLGGFIKLNPETDYYKIIPLKAEKDPDHDCVCEVIREDIYISAEGRALPCMPVAGTDIQEDFPYILEKGLKKCLTDSSYIEFITRPARDVINHNQKCKKCEFASRCCGGCRAMALNSNREDILGTDENACLFLRDGYVERVQELMKRVAPQMKMLM